MKTRCNNSKVILNSSTGPSIPNSKEAQHGAELRTQSIQSRVDSYTTPTFTVLAVLIAVLGIVVTRSPEFPYFSAGVYVGAISLWFALRAFYWASLSPMANAGIMTARRRWLEIVVGIFQH